MADAPLVISLLALVVAGASALYTRRQSAAQARATIIEDDRRHDELTPVFEATAHGTGSGHLCLLDRKHLVEDVIYATTAAAST